MIIVIMQIDYQRNALIKRYPNILCFEISHTKMKLTLSVYRLELTLIFQIPRFIYIKMNKEKVYIYIYTLFF